MTSFLWYLHYEFIQKQNTSQSVNGFYLILFLFYLCLNLFRE
jgi:DMSO/TMAO reductase YedYZ heme-binding membrane subunit